MKLKKLMLSAAAISVGIVTAPLSAADGKSASPVNAGEEVIHDVLSLGVKGPVMAPASGPEAEGPFSRLIIANVHVIDGTGAPAYGPVNIEIIEDRISKISAIGGTRTLNDAAPKAAADTKVIDGKGGYVLPGFIDTHEHLGTPTHIYGGQLTEPDYVFKLLLAHGITTMRDPGSLLGLKWTAQHRQLSAEGKITAPWIFAYALFPEHTPTPEAARAWIRAAKQNGADGVKFLGADPVVFEASIAELNKLGMGSAYHHSQLAVTRQTAVKSAEEGLQSIEHWYGIPESMFTDRTVQNYPNGYNYNDEQDRFGEAGRLWQQSTEPGSPIWTSTIERLVKSKVTLAPTFVGYEASRDLARAKRLEWHDQYTMPYAWKSWAANPRVHGSFFFDWTTSDEIAWRNNYRLWMHFVNDYKNAGGRVSVGADSGFIYNLYGLGYIRELELLQEAGFHPLEAIRAATLNGAELLKIDGETGTIALNKRADIVVVQENPLRNFKVLYGTDQTVIDRQSGKASQTTGIRYTIKGGIVYDAKLMLQQVREMVAAKKAPKP